MDSTLRFLAPIEHDRILELLKKPVKYKKHLATQYYLQMLCLSMFYHIVQEMLHLKVKNVYKAFRIILQ